MAPVPARMVKACGDRRAILVFVIMRPGTLFFRARGARRLESASRIQERASPTLPPAGKLPSEVTCQAETQPVASLSCTECPTLSAAIRIAWPLECRDWRALRCTDGTPVRRYVGTVPEPFSPTRRAGRWSLCRKLKLMVSRRPTRPSCLFAGKKVVVLPSSRPPHTTNLYGVA